MSLMKLCAYILGCVTVGQLTEAMVLQEGKAPGYPSNQLYGPVSPNNDCPTVDGIKQYPAKYYK
ncbi:hypothetical protein Pmar_PMAR015891, partial [Perkinsus marinus ATCC 50983]